MAAAEKAGVISPVYAHYPRAPITEALLDIRVAFEKAPSLDQLQQVLRAAESEYPTRESVFHVRGSFTLAPALGSSTERLQTGYLLRNEQRGRIFRVELNGMSASKLAPYGTWEDLRDEARRLWQIYSDVTNPKSFTRLAVRYVNRIELPLPLISFSDYLRLAPELPPELPQALTGFVSQYQIPLEDVKCLVVINEALMGQTVPESVPMLLDIDVFRTADLPQNSEEVWALFEILRAKKNQIFEACLTEKARELFR